MYEAVQWAAANRTDAAMILATRTHSSNAHSRRALTEMFDREVSPLDLKINRKAIETVFENMHHFELVPKDVPLSYGACVDDSFLAADR
jgi:cobalamin biosynthesis protein CobD/CbiB